MGVGWGGEGIQPISQPTFCPNPDTFPFFSYFFVKKYLLVGAWGMLWAGGSVVQWISGSVRDVCMSHQSDWIYY